MNLSMEKTDLILRLNKIFLNKFNIDILDNNLDIDYNDNLFDYKFKFSPRDLIYLLHDIEDEFDVEISEESISEVQFNTINNIIIIIDKELKLKTRF